MTICYSDDGELMYLLILFLQAVVFGSDDQMEGEDKRNG